jgi:hypothetical protein
VWVRGLVQWWQPVLALQLLLGLWPQQQPLRQVLV